MARKQDAPPPFEGLVVYGPYLSRKQKRRFIKLMQGSRHHKTMSYARYLMSVYLGRELLDVEEVDHLNGDGLDDRIENYEVVTHTENMRRASKGPVLVTLTCPHCGQGFTKERRQTHLGKGANYKGSPTCCSRSCAVRNQHARRRSSEEEQSPGKGFGSSILPRGSSGDWCSGNTSGFGPEVGGSTPPSPALRV